MTAPAHDGPRPPDRLPVRLARGALAALMATIVVVPFVEVSARAAGRPLAYVTEAVPDLFVWLTFLGAIVASREGTHLGIPLLRDRLPGPARRAAEALEVLAVAAFAAVIVVASCKVLQVSIAGGDRLALGHPAWTVELALPVGAAGMAVATALWWRRRDRAGGAERPAAESPAAESADGGSA